MAGGEGKRGTVRVLGVVHGDVVLTRGIRVLPRPGEVALLTADQRGARLPADVLP